MESTATGLREAFCNRKAKAAAGSGTAVITAHKAGRQRIAVHGKLVLRDILDCHDGVLPLLLQLHVDTRTLKRILCRVLNKVLEHTVHALPISINGEVLLRDLHAPRQLAVVHHAVHISERLPQKLIETDVFRHQRNIAGCGFRDIENILQHMAQTVCFLRDDLQIILHVRRQIRLGLHQFNIADDGRERRFDVVRNIRDKLHLRALGFDAFLHRDTDAVTDHIELHSGIIKRGSSGQVIHRVKVALVHLLHLLHQLAIIAQVVAQCPRKPYKRTHTRGKQTDVKRDKPNRTHQPMAVKEHIS